MATVAGPLDANLMILLGSLAILIVASVIILSVFRSRNVRMAHRHDGLHHHEKGVQAEKKQ